jgi:hypothetical protein
MSVQAEIRFGGTGIGHCFAQPIPDAEHVTMVSVRIGKVRVVMHLVEVRRNEQPAAGRARRLGSRNELCERLFDKVSTACLTNRIFKRCTREKNPQAQKGVTKRRHRPR